MSRTLLVVIVSATLLLLLLPRWLAPHEGRPSLPLLCGLMLAEVLLLCLVASGVVS